MFGRGRVAALRRAGVVAAVAGVLVGSAATTQASGIGIGTGGDWVTDPNCGTCF